jgi:hypothetical protein
MLRMQIYYCSYALAKTEFSNISIIYTLAFLKASEKLPHFLHTLNIFYYYSCIKKVKIILENKFKVFLCQSRNFSPTSEETSLIKATQK